MFWRLLMCCLLAGGIDFSWQASAQEKPKAEGQSSAMTATIAGQETYRSYCASCHGLDAKGNGPAASALKKAPADLTFLAKKSGGKFPAARVSSIIRGNDFIVDHGLQGMPVWGNAFRAANHDETMVELKIRNLTVYLRSVQQK